MNQSAKGVASLKLTVAQKKLFKAFFIVEMQGNYSAIIRSDQIQANPCISFMLHQFINQWYGNEVETMHADPLIVVVVANTPPIVM